MDGLSFESVTLIFSGVVALSTVVYAYLTYQLVTETRTMRKIQTEPQVYCSIMNNPRYFIFKHLVIENIGNGSAYDISLSIKPDIKISNEKYASQLSIFAKGIKTLGPNQRVQTEFFNIRDLSNEIETVEITITYHNSNRERYSTELVVDLSLWFDNKFTGFGENGEIIGKLNDIADILKSFSNRTDRFPDKLDKIASNLDQISKKIK